jgi:hypothetical protein
MADSSSSNKEPEQCIVCATCTAHLIEQNSSIGRGGVDLFVARPSVKANLTNGQKFFITSGNDDALVIPADPCENALLAGSLQDTTRTTMYSRRPDFIPVVIEKQNAVLLVSYVPSSNVFRKTCRSIIIVYARTQP